MMKFESTKNLIDKNYANRNTITLINSKIIIILLIFIIFIVTTIFYNNYYKSSKYSLLQNTINTLLINNGFLIKNIDLTGNNIIKRSEILNTFESYKNKNIFNVDLLKIHSALLSNRWIENLEIKRILPNTIKIKITEKKAVAIWQTKFGNNLITQKGDVISDTEINNFYNTLPIIIGKEANKKASYILKILKGNPELYNRIWSISYVNKRRWNIHLKEGLTILFPKNNLKKAWNQIQYLQYKYKILELGLTEIDVRNKNKILGKIDVSKKFYSERKKLL